MNEKKSIRGAIEDDTNNTHHIKVDASGKLMWHNDFNIVLDQLYGLNSLISARYIGLKETPSEEDLMGMNRGIGDCIKRLRDVKEMRR